MSTLTSRAFHSNIHAAETVQRLSRRNLTLIFSIAMLAVMLSRWALSYITLSPFVPPHLYSFDTVNLALALKDFNPARNQPQPPGYPLFVAEARVFSVIFGAPENTFAVLECLISALSLGMLYILGRLLFSNRVGLFAAAMFFVNPVFWFSLLTSPLRPHLALVSILVAYFCWRAASGEPRYFYAASLALGIGSGFRPELLVLLFPLWAWTAWHTRGRVRLWLGVFFVGITAMAWITAIAVASGGFAQMLSAFSHYSSSQTEQTSFLLDARSGNWLRWAGRGFVWTGIGVVPWIWTIPYGWRARQQLPEWQKLLFFLAAWFLPIFVFHLAVHMGDPDHALSTIPALCLIGGFSVAAAEESMNRWKWLPEISAKGKVAIWIAVAGNLLLFFGQYKLPERAQTTGFHGLRSLEDAIIFGNFETSYSRVRWVDQMMDLAVPQIADLKSSTTHPVLLLWGKDGEPVWRKVCYYFPSDRLYALDEAGGYTTQVAEAQLWTGSRLIERHAGPPLLQISVPKGGRLIWIVSPATAESLGHSVPLQKAAPLYYTDLAPDAQAFQWGSFQFSPE